MLRVGASSTWPGGSVARPASPRPAPLVFLRAGFAAVGALTLGIVVPLVTGSSRLGVYGPFFTLLWLAFTAHSIVRRRLMDVAW